MGVPQFRYKGFVSYSHAADGRIAATLQKELQRFGKSWYRLRTIRIFRDKTGLSVSPELWGSIQEALKQSEYFVLLASTESMRSSWVTQELDWWLRNRSSENLLIVLTDGELHWNRTTGDFDWHTTTALPSRLAKAFAEEPNHIDLRFAADDIHLSLRHPEFHYAVASLSATLQGCSLDELVSEELVNHRQRVRWITAASVVLILLSAVTAIAVHLASNASNTAQKIAYDIANTEQQVQRDALSQKLADKSRDIASNDHELATLLAVEAVLLSPSEVAKTALRLSLFESISPLKTLPDHTGTIRVLPFDSSEKIILAGRNAELSVLNIATGKTIHEFAGHTGPVTNIDISTDETQLLSGSEDDILSSSTDDSSVRVWDISTGQSLFQIEVDSLNFAFFSPDAQRILTVGRAAVLWNANTGLQMHSIAHPYAQSRGSSIVTDAVFNPASTQIATIDWSRPAVYEVINGKLLFELDDHTDSVNGIAYSPDGNWLVTASSDHTARVWHATSGERKAILPHETSVRFAFFSPGGKWIITGTQDNVLHVWESDTYQKERSIDFGFEELRSFGFSPDGEYLLVTFINEGSYVLEIQSGEQVVELTGQDGPLLDFHFSQTDGQRIVTVDLSGQINVYDFHLGGLDSQQLVQLAKTRVPRELTVDERQRYLPALDQ